MHAMGCSDARREGHLASLRPALVSPMFTGADIIARYIPEDSSTFLFRDNRPAERAAPISTLYVYYIEEKVERTGRE